MGKIFQVGRLLFSKVAISLACMLSTPADATGWMQPETTVAPESVACHEPPDSPDTTPNSAHGMVCLRLDCVGHSQYRFTIIADYGYVGNTVFSADSNSTTLNMETYQSSEPRFADWNVSVSPVDAVFLDSIASEKEIKIRCESCNGITIPLDNFASELRRVASSCR